jgi:hypothetical protein
MGLLCAGVLLGVTGCTLDSLTVAWNGGSVRREQTINGSLASVSASIKDTLVQQGLIFSTSYDDDSMKVQSATNGQKFWLVAKRKKTATGEQTVVHIDWEKNPDEKFWLSLLEVVGNMQSQQSQQNQQVLPADYGFRPTTRP